MTTLDQIKSLMKSGDVAGAEALCRKALEKEPDNAEIKMRYGICRELLGDEKTFKEIHDELAPEMERLETVDKQQGRESSDVTAGTEDSPPPLPSASAPEMLSLWRKYHKIWLALIVGALVLGGAAAGVILTGNSIRNSFLVMMYAGPVAPEKITERNDFNLYAGPKYEEAVRFEENRETHAE